LRRRKKRYTCIVIEISSAANAAAMITALAMGLGSTTLRRHGLLPGEARWEGRRLAALTWLFLVLNILFKHLEWGTTNTQKTVGPAPKHWLAVMARTFFGIIFAKTPGGSRLQCVDRLGQLDRRRHPEKNMDVIRLPGQLDEAPSPSALDDVSHPLLHGNNHLSSQCGAPIFGNEN
jgi:hypothetical protein